MSSFCSIALTHAVTPGVTISSKAIHSLVTEELSCLQAAQLLTGEPSFSVER